MHNLKTLQNIVKTSNFDALLLLSAPNRFYATGFRSSDGMAIVTADDALFATDSRYFELAERELSGGFKVKLITRASIYHTLAAEFLAEKKIGKVGFEDEYLTVKAYKKWEEKLPKINWVPAVDQITAARAVKKDWEIDFMRKAQRIAECALTGVFGVIKPGMSERELAAEVIYRMLKGGADGLSFDPIVVSGPNSSLPHGEPGDRKIEPGDFVTFDVGCKYMGYCSDMTRTVAIGHASEEMRKVYQIVLDAQLAGIKSARAGVWGETIHETAAAVIKNAGYGEYFGHGFGHGLGIEVHECNGAYPKNKKPLAAGEVISAEPGIYLPGKFGVRIEDCIVIRESGAENLMQMPKELTIIPV